MTLSDILRGLAGAVGNNKQNDEEDVRTVRTALETLGYFGDDEQERDYEGKPLGIITARLENKTKKFQADNKLKVDGVLNPGGETITEMNRKLRERNEQRAEGATLVPLYKPRVFEPLKDGNLEAAREMADEEKEGNKPFLYKDSEGNITVGIGRMLPAAKDAESLDFYKHEKGSNRREAKREEIRAAFDVVKRSKGINRADFYDPDKKGSEFSNLQISPESREAMAVSDLVYHAGRLRQKFSNFDRMDLDAQKALVDMHFNMGEGNFNRIKWDDLYKAVDKEDWETAARESRRMGIPKERNDWTYNQFKIAAQRKREKTK